MEDSEHAADTQAVEVDFSEPPPVVNDEAVEIDFGEPPVVNDEDVEALDVVLPLSPAKENEEENMKSSQFNISFDV